MLENSLLLKAKNIPNKVGVYLFLKNKSVLYIGKSTRIRSRVLSYFNSSTKKSELIIEGSDDLSFFLVDNEKDALFLENNLIKQHKPKYNILLRDDKSFPWLCIKNERFPRVFISRNKTNSNDFFYGPYVNRWLLKSLYEIIKDFYYVRSCNYFLSEKNIESKKYKVCLEYHLRKCLGPCVGFQGEKEYIKNIESVKSLLEGRFSFLLKKLKKDLAINSKNLLFEKCEELKKQIDSISLLKSKSIVVSNNNSDLFSFYIFSVNNYSYVNFINVVEGSIIYMKNYKLKNSGIFSDKHILKTFIKNSFVNYGKLSNNIISNIFIENFLELNVKNPKRGYKKSILDLGFKNILNYINIQSSDNFIGVLLCLKKDLNLKKIPFLIDCFDVSTLQGSNTTASCVCFKNGKPFKKNYKHFSIKNNNIIDDYLSISEAVKRRYINNNYFPDLIIIDGGKGHLKTVINILKDTRLKDINIISIAKKEEIIYLKNFKKLVLNKKSNSLKLIQKLRNEAHRFCLKHHRIKRKNNFIKTELNSITGLGEKTIFKLLNKYKSINKIKSLPEEKLIKFLGLKKGSLLYNYFNKQ